MISESFSWLNLLPCYCTDFDFDEFSFLRGHRDMENERLEELIPVPPDQTAVDTAYCFESSL